MVLLSLIMHRLPHEPGCAGAAGRYCTCMVDIDVLNVCITDCNGEKFELSVRILQNLMYLYKIIT